MRRRKGTLMIRGYYYGFLVNSAPRPSCKEITGSARVQCKEKQSGSTIASMWGTESPLAQSTLIGYGRKSTVVAIVDSNNSQLMQCATGRFSDILGHEEEVRELLGDTSAAHRPRNEPRRLMSVANRSRSDTIALNADVWMRRLTTARCALDPWKQGACTYIRCKRCEESR